MFKMICEAAPVTGSAVRRTFGSFANGANINDTFVFPCNSFISALIQSIRIKVNGVQLQSVNDYARCSALFEMVTVGLDENDILNGNDCYLNKDYYIPPDAAGTAEKYTVDNQGNYLYKGLNKYAYEKIKRLNDSTSGGRSLPFFWIGGRLNCQLFNDINSVIGPNCTVELDFTIQDNYEYNMVRYTRNGHIAGVTTPDVPLTITKATDRNSPTVDSNIFKIGAEDVSLFVDTFQDNPIIDSSLFMKSRNLFSYIKNLQPGTTSEAIVVRFPSQCDLICVSFQDSRIGNPGYSTTDFSLQKTTRTVNLVDLYEENSAQRLISSVELLMDITYPSQRYLCDNRGTTNNDLSECHRAYLDSMMNLSMLQKGTSTPLTFSEWLIQPVFVFRPRKTELNEGTINLVFNGQLAAYNSCFVMGIYDESIEIIYDSTGHPINTIVTK
jgi:hypothetical protein